VEHIGEILSKAAIAAGFTNSEKVSQYQDTSIIKETDKVQFKHNTFGYPVKNGVRDGLRISLDYHKLYTVKVVYTDRIVVTLEDTDLELETFQDFIRTKYIRIEV